jgi:endonuclease G
MSVELENDPDFDKTLLARAKDARARWDTRTQKRELRTVAVNNKAPFDADSKSRLAMRVNRLVNEVRLSSRDRRPPDNPTLKRLVESSGPIAAEDLRPEIVNEVVIGARDFLSVEFLEKGTQVVRCVGRILINTHAGTRARGTGFLVAPGVVMTNEHVLRSEEQANACVIEMDYEQNRFGAQRKPQIFQLDPQRLFVNHPELDFALVAVAPQGDQGSKIEDYGWLPLNQELGKIAITSQDYLNIIQHPLGREKEVVVRENRALDLKTDESDADIGPFVHYTADTEKGSSGSPVLNDQWEVVALHHSGVPKTNSQGEWLSKDETVWKEGRDPVTSLAWVANEGIRVSSLIAEISRTSKTGEGKRLLDSVISAQSMPIGLMNRGINQKPQPNKVVESNADASPPRDAAQAGPTQNPAKEPAGATTFEVPLRITVSLGGASQAEIATPPSRTRKHAEILTEAIPPEDYADRKGFVRNFLGVEVPFPTMKSQPRFGGVLKIAKPSRPQDQYELKYHNFSILMNKKRRLAYVSACNINFKAPVTISRDEGTGSWRFDPRLENHQQLGAPYYYGKKNLYDKGHLTRRDDCAWGTDEDQAVTANWDSFHYTNSAPQHELFNRSTVFTGANLDLWGDLENHITDQGKKNPKICVFNGPIFSNDDKPLGDSYVPLKYFKIVVWRDPGSPPGAMGFILDQSEMIAELPEDLITKEAFDPGKFEIRQKPIKTIEKLLDISFGDVTSWDQTPSFGEANVTNESLDQEGIELKSVKDIVFKGK